MMVRRFLMVALLLGLACAGGGSRQAVSGPDTGWLPAPRDMFPEGPVRPYDKKWVEEVNPLIARAEATLERLIAGPLVPDRDLERQASAEFLAVADRAFAVATEARQTWRRSGRRSDFWAWCAYATFAQSQELASTWMITRDPLDHEATMILLDIAKLHAQHRRLCWEKEEGR